MASKVYFTRALDGDAVVKMFKKVGVELKGKIALKIHSGEVNGPYFLKPAYLKPIYDLTKGTFVECNAAYKDFFARGSRYTTELHQKILKDNGWEGTQFVIMDENPEKDKKIKVEGGEIIKENILGEHYDEFDSLLVVAHFKGHPVGGFGGALKQLSIGFASRAGKTQIHTAGKTLDYNICFDNCCTAKEFCKGMGEAASSVHKYYKAKNMGGPVYICVLKDISLYCDCTGLAAPAPEINDIGILSSTDPVAIDQACLDLIKKTKDKGTEKFLEQVKNLSGEEALTTAEKLGAGSTKYELVFDEGDGPKV